MMVGLVFFKKALVGDRNLTSHSDYFGKVLIGKYECVENIKFTLLKKSHGT